MTQTNTRKFVTPAPLRWEHTIQWAMRRVPEHHKGEDRLLWVAEHLARLHHWGALEEFLQQWHQQDRIAKGDPC